MAGRPEIQRGFLGPQSKFEEFGLSLVSALEPEIVTAVNKVEVGVRFSKPVKITATLTNCAKSEELPQHVFTQTRGNVTTLYASLPEMGYYKFQLFALPLPDDSKTLPGVYNFLVNCTNMSVPVNTYPKQYAQWKEGCFINEPVCLRSDGNLSSVKFDAHIPNAKTVAVVAEGEWNHLSKGSEDMWSGVVNLEAYRGKDSKVTLNANWGADNKFSSLLEYKI